MRNVFVASASGELRKLDAAGSPVWIRSFGSLVDLDESLSIFVAGTFEGQLELDSSRSISAAGGTDAFVAKLDEDGNVLAAVALGGAGDETATSIAAASDGVVVSGAGLGVVKLTGSDLHTAWQRPLEGAVAVDAGDDVLVTGALVGSVTFDRTLTSAGGEDVLVVKLSPAGDYLWSRSFGDSGKSQRGQAITVAPSGAVLVGGVVDGAVDFGGGPITVSPGSCPSEARCGSAGFVLALDAAGTFSWSRGIVPAVEISGIATDAAGNVYATGSNPGNAAPPYRTPLFVGFDAEGRSRKVPAYDSAPGAGHAIATDGCGDVVLAFATSLSPDEPGGSYVAKLLLP